jgi:translin
MNNLKGIINKIEKEISEKEQVKEQALRLSRIIVITCRKAIQNLHQNQFEIADSLINKASATLLELNKSSSRFPDIVNSGFVENASQEYVEAYCLFNILQGQNLPDPDTIHTTYTAYLTGLCDVVGELRRKTLDTILIGEYKKAHQFLEIMDEIYDSIIRFDYPSSLIPIKRKQDISRSLIEKTRGELAVASCEKRIEFRTDEFKGLIDSISHKSKSKEKRKKHELNIDRVL